MRTDIHNGAMYTLSDIVSETGGTDGTYVAQLSAELVTDTAPHYWRPTLRLTPAAERSGYEVAYDAVSPESPFPTEGGPRAYLREGDRVGIWTAPDGTVCVDRTVHLQGGDLSLAWVLGREFSQDAIWDWAAGVARDESGEIV